MSQITRMSMGQKASAGVLSKRVFLSGSDGSNSPRSRGSRGSESSGEREKEQRKRRLRRIKTLNRLSQAAAGERQEHPYEARFNVLMGALIVFNILIIAVETDALDASSGSTESKIVWIIIDTLFFLVFLGEAGIRMYLEREHWVRSPWNWFDVAVVVIALADVIVLASVDGGGQDLVGLQIFRIVRLARLVRLVKLVRLMADLRTMVNALWHALQTMSFLIVIMVFGLLIYSILAVNYIGRNEALSDVIINGHGIDKLFGSIPRSMYSLFQLMTLEAWDETWRPIIVRQPGLLFFLLSFMVFFTFGMLNMTVALVIEKTMHHTTLAEEQALEAERQKMAEELVRACAEIAPQAFAAKRGQMSDYQFKKVLEDSEIIEGLFEDMGVTKGAAQELFSVLDWDGSGDLTVTELMAGLAKLQRGVPSAWDHWATLSCVRSVQNSLIDLEVKIERAVEEQVSWRNSLELRLEELTNRTAKLLASLVDSEARRPSTGSASPRPPSSELPPALMGYPQMLLRPSRPSTR
mmetsp:Transcript_2822/g.8385  ORF Transcript_2822/g.8385 Transcript_2822/m.8385 type:complete len:523 (+) Transcript_2822:111-1679(+)